ncbi:ATP-binding protein [Clostridium sp.]|uniref:ATP-binding protein n=1 Tax=Clostridium sp. TaxID=1506 RepID=UPI002FC9F7F7
MNFRDTLLSVEMIIETNEVPLVVGESGIGKTALAKELAKKKGWNLVVIDGNLLKEGEIGGLPTVEEYKYENDNGNIVSKRRTVYAVHTKLQEIDNLIFEDKEILLFIDEINRCEHSVQQELMNLILNREINGYSLHERVKILAAMNPSSKYGEDFDYQVVDMDAAQENRFVWLNMDSDVKTWLHWARENNIEEKVMEFISTFPEYLHKADETESIKSTPRSFERISKSYRLYKESYNNVPKRIFLNVLRGNVGSKIAQEFMVFVEEDNKPLISFEEVFNEEGLSKSIIEKIKRESHTRLYLSAKNILHRLNTEEFLHDYISKFITFISFYPVDLRLGVMQDIKENCHRIYNMCLENEEFIELYFQGYNEIKG